MQSTLRAARSAQGVGVMKNKDDLARRRRKRQLELKLGPAEVKGNITNAGLFLIAFELLRSEIIDPIKGFYLVSEGLESTPAFQREYSAEVLSLHENLFHASCLWLVNAKAFAAADMELALAIRKHRNRIAHDLPRLLTDPASSVDAELLKEAYRLLSLTGQYWGRLSVDINPVFDGSEVPDSEIMSGSMVLMSYIHAVVSEP
jgi:hypothetical protein